MINPYFPPQEMMDEIAGSLAALSRNYPSTNRHISLLLSNYLNQDVDKVVVANGASELISAIGYLFIKNLAIPIPTFDEYINRLRIQEKGVSLYKMEEESFTLHLDSFIKFAEESGSNTVLLVRPNNPTGNLIAKTEVEHTLEKLAKFDVVLVDESFIEFAATKGNASVIEFVNAYDNIIVLKSLSKVYGVPGLRIGCAISGNVERMDTLRRQLPIWNINSFAQRFLELLEDYRVEFEESCVKTIWATQKLYMELSKLDCLYPYPTQANFVLCRLKNGATSSELATFLFENFGILICDCGTKAGLDSRFVRIASRDDEENGELIAAMRAWEGRKK